MIFAPCVPSLDRRPARLFSGPQGKKPREFYANPHSELLASKLTYFIYFTPLLPNRHVDVTDSDDSYRQGGNLACRPNHLGAARTRQSPIFF